MRDMDRTSFRRVVRRSPGDSLAVCVRMVLKIGTRVPRRNAGTALGGRGDVRALLESRGGGGGLSAAGGGARRATFASATRPGHLLAVSSLKQPSALTASISGVRRKWGTGGQAGGVFAGAWVRVSERTVVSEGGAWI